MRFHRRLLLAACFLPVVAFILATVLRRPIGEELFDRAAAAPVAAAAVDAAPAPASASSPGRTGWSSMRAPAGRNQAE